MSLFPFAFEGFSLAISASNVGVVHVDLALLFISVVVSIVTKRIVFDLGSLNFVSLFLY